MEEEIIFEQPNEEQYYIPNNQNINSESNRNLAERIENAKDAIDIAKGVKSMYQGAKANKTPQNEIRNSDLNNDRELQKSKIENARKKSLANNNNNNNQLTNKLASKALASKGVPQPLADKMVNSKLGQKAIEAGKQKIPALNALDKASKLMNKKTEETEKQEGNQEVISSQSMIKFGLIAGGAFVGFLFIILILIMGVSYSITGVLGNADAVAGEDAGEKLEQYEEAYNYEVDSDLYVYNERTNKFAQNKLNSMNTLSIFSKRKYNESDLNKLKEFFGSSVFDIDTKDMNTVYDFYFKLYDLYTRYSEKYNVSLDLPLLMSTLYLESDDVLDIFKSNTKGYKHKNYKNKSLTDTTELDLEYDWSGYKISNKHSDHDIEILAQYMVSKGSDGKYKVDNKKYKEFLREFIEKKYYLNKSKEYEFDNYIGNLGVESTNNTEGTSTSGTSAYNFKNSDNEIKVGQDIEEIYSRKEQYEFLAGKKEETLVQYVEVVSDNSAYWWPIGSDEITEMNGKQYAVGAPAKTGISSPFGYRSIRGGAFHNGIDIPGNYRVTNVIASKSGVVTKARDGNFDNNHNANVSCSTANYVIIKHDDGTTAWYYHLGKNTITVKVGERVDQGQVIGKTASSGCSTGSHLHFQINDVNGKPINPSTLVDPKNPRPGNSSSDVFKLLKHLEGGVTGEYLSADKKSYKIYGDEYVQGFQHGLLTVGPGVTLRWNPQRFEKRGYTIEYNPKSSEVYNYKAGDFLPISVIDDIALEILNEHKTAIKKILSREAIIWKEYQIDAAAIMLYQRGNSGGRAEEIVSKYKELGDTDALGDWWCSVGNVKKRRKTEWKLFHTGDYGV